MRSLMNKIMTILLMIYLLYLLNLMMTHMSLPRHQTNNCCSRFITNMAQDRSQTQESILVPSPQIKIQAMRTKHSKQVKFLQPLDPVIKALRQKQELSPSYTPRKGNLLPNNLCGVPEGWLDDSGSLLKNQ